MSERIVVLGTRLESRSAEESLEKIREFLTEDGLKIAGIITAGTLLEAEKSAEYRQQIEQLNLGIIRDREVLEAAGITVPERLWEAEDNWVMADLVHYLEAEQKSVVLLAQTAQGRAAQEQDLQEICPSIHIAGSFSLEELEAEGEGMDSLLNRLNAIAADVIFAYLPSPFQENFVYGNRQKINARLWIGLGKNSSVQKGSKARQKFLERILERRSFRKRVAEFHE